MTDHHKAHHGIIGRLYGVLGAALLLSLVPMVEVALISMVLFIAALFLAYRDRKRNEVGSLVDNHATYLIRTIWISGLIALVTSVIAAIYMLPQIDSDPLLPCMNEIIADATDIEATLRPCYADYMYINRTVFVTAGFIALAPLYLYLLWRFVRGLIRATKGYRIDNEKSWF